MRNFFTQHLSDKEKEAVIEALETVEETGLRFITMVWSENGRGEILSNIPPFDTIRVLEEAIEIANTNPPRVKGVTN
jgi:hypothetical protein